MKNDDKIQALISTVEEKIKVLGKKKRQLWRTNAVFRFDVHDYFNINTVVNIQELVRAAAFLLTQTAQRDAAVVLLGRPILEKFHWNGYSMDDWVEDFKTRIATIEYDKKKKQLRDLRKQLDGLFTSEGKTGLELEAIVKLLS